MPTSRMPPAEVARRSFSTARRGFDPEEVRTFLETVSRELQAAERREQELLRDLADAEERARHPVVDEALLTSALGQRSAAVLRNAHEEAARITQQAEEAAAALLRDAQHQATEMEVRAESSSAERIAEAELACNAVRQQALDEAAAIVETARLEAEAIGERAREHGRAMLDQAQEARRRVLADMAQRRRAITDQIEQFRAARDEIAASVIGVRHSVDRIVDDLRRADDAARSAAAAAAQHGPRSADEQLLVEEAEQAASDIGAPTGADARDAASGFVEPPEPEPGEAAPHLRAEDVAVPVWAGLPGGDRPAAGGVPADAGVVERRTAAVPEADLASSTAPAPAPSPLPEADEGGPGSNVGPQERSTWEDPVEAERPAPAGPSVRILSGRHPTARESVPAEVGEGVDPAGGPGPAPGAPAWTARGAAPKAGARAPGQPAERVVEGGEAAGDVEVLFARLRAVLPDSETPGGAGMEAAAAGRAADPDAPAPAPGDAAGTEEAPGATAAAEVDGREATAEEEALSRRADALGPIVSSLARRLKRALQDDQNRLLDRLRQGTGEWHDELLAGEESQRELYRRAATAGMREAVGAGIAFARSFGPPARGKAPAPDTKTVDRLSEDLAASVVTLLRRRLEGDDVADAGERVGAAYREWRGERIERLAEDRALDAFGVGSLAGAPNGTTLRWVTASDGTGCADCEDNALAGDVYAGDQFPTGHRHPPAHAGCRCLALPTPK